MPKLDRNGDGSVGVSDFIPSFLDRDGDGRISRKDIMHDAKLKVDREAGEGGQPIEIQPAAPSRWHYSTSHLDHEVNQLRLYPGPQQLLSQL